MLSIWLFLKIVYQEAMSIATMLDERFGAERDVEDDEGGFIFIALNSSDLSYFKKNYVELNSELLEYVLPVDDYLLFIYMAMITELTYFCQCQ